MQIDDPNILALESFEGPIDFLLHLIQKKEIDIYEVSIKEITEQFIQKLQKHFLNLDNGAEFIGATATLLWLKSKMLLPKHEEEIFEMEEDFNFSILYELIDHYRFKETATTLSEKERQQSLQHVRGQASFEWEQNSLGIEHLTLSDLATVFQKALDKMPKMLRLQREKWHLSDKIALIRNHIKELLSFDLEDFLLSSSCKEELIVSFLAVLELMKLSEICIVASSEKIQVVKLHE